MDVQNQKLNTSSLPEVVISVHDIVADETFNIRGAIDDDRVTVLSQDIEQRGMLQPIVVWHRFDNETGGHRDYCPLHKASNEIDLPSKACNCPRDGKKEYFLLSGFRRRRALLKIIERDANFSPMVRATLVQPKTIEEAEDINTAENLDREAIRRYDLCKRFYTQHNRYGTSQNEIAKNLNISRPTVQSCIKVYGALSPNVREKWSKCPRPEDEPPFSFLIEISTKSHIEQEADFALWSGENVGEEIDYNKNGKRRVRNFIRGRALIEGKVKQYAEGSPEWRTLMWVLGKRADI